jgi:FemAB-related protein (PEP-CTERM system-associated)
MILRIEHNERAAETYLWDRYVLDHTQGTGYHLTAWRGVIEKVFGHSTIYLMAVDDKKQVRGVLPLVVLSSKLFGRFMVSVPFFNYGGIVADSRSFEEELLDAAAAVAREHQISHIELRQQSPLNLGLPSKIHKVSMRLQLPQDAEALWKTFPSKLRSQIRRGEKEGLTAKLGGLDLLDDFYGVFARNMRDLGTPVYGKGFFREILQTFPKESKVCVVYHGETPLAAGFLYGYRQTLEIPWASSDRRWARFAPNMMLYGTVLKFACENGYREFDFGRSSADSKTYQFKAQWGAKPVQLYWYYWLQEGSDFPEINPQNPKYHFAIEIWKRLPVGLTTLIGPRIAKYLP